MIHAAKLHASPDWKVHVKLLAALLLLPLVSFAAPKPDEGYKDAVLKGFVTIPAALPGDANTNCSDTMVAYYTIVIAEQTLVIEPFDE